MASSVVVSGVLEFFLIGVLCVFHDEEHKVQLV